MRLKKSIIVIALALITLTGCESLFYTDTSATATTSGHGLVFNGYAYSSGMSGAKFDKSEKMIIVASLTDFGWQRLIEENLKNNLIASGYNVVAASDIYPKSLESEANQGLWDAMDIEDPRYVLYINLEDMYTYTHGGGISSLVFEVKIDDHLIWDQILTMSVSADCAYNELVSYRASLEPASKCISDSIAKELTKYFN